MNSRRDRPSRPWSLYALGAVAVVVAVLAVAQIGPPTSSARTTRQIVTASQGVVQSTVTGSGNVAAGTDVNVNFNTSGTLQNVYVSVGQHVSQGQLLATLDPTTAQLALNQANQNLTAAQDNLACLQGTSTNCGSGGGSGAGAGSGSSSTTGTTTGASYTGGSATTVFAAYRPSGPASGAGQAGSSLTTTVTTTTTTPAGSTTTPPSSAPGAGGGGSGSRGSSGSAGGSGRSGSSSAAGSAASASSVKASSTTTTTPSPSSIASAQAAVYSAEASVHNAQLAVNNTKLYAPASGTIATLSGLVPGDSVSSGASGAASSGGSSPSSSGSGSGAGGGGGTTAGSLGGSGSSSSGSSSAFAEIVNTSALSMTVAFSESDITKVKVGQPATVTLDAVPGTELAAHVSQISLIGTTSSSVVSYNATLTLDQNDARVKPGMSASAAVIVGQAQGVTVPNQAITGSGSLASVELMRGGKTVSQQVVVGLRGDSRTQIISGVNAGDQLVVTIVLPSLSSTSTTGGGNGALGGGRGGLGGGGLGGGGLGGGGLGSGAFLRRAAGGG
jgi:multidrug efflux pump subunit AcrA (membrane-fusion protein)